VRLEVVRQGSVDLVKRRDSSSFHQKTKIYLFTKSTDLCRTTLKHIRKASTLLPSFRIAPKHHIRMNKNLEKRRSFLNNNVKKDQAGFPITLELDKIEEKSP
jgi:hypothetical protein